MRSTAAISSEAAVRRGEGPVSRRPVLRGVVRDRADAVKAAEIEQNWKAVLAHPKQANASPTAGGSRRVELRAYELRIPFANPTDLESARDRIAGLKSENIVVGIETPRPPGAKYFSSTFQDGVAAGVLHHARQGLHEPRESARR